MEAPIGADRGESHGSAVVPAVYSPHAVSVMRSLAERDVRTIAAYERATPALGSRFCDESVLVPDPEDDLEGYRDALLSLARRPAVRAIVPMREVDVYVLSRHRSAFARHVDPTWPSFEAVRAAHDRLRLLEAARDAGVGVPETTLLGEVDDWTPRQVLKPRFAFLTTDYVDETVTRPREPGSVRYLDRGVEPDVAEVRTEMDHDPLVQTYVPGEEYALWALYIDGEPAVTCGKRQVRGQTYAGGTSVYRETVRVPGLEAAGRRLLDRLEWHGLASVQFKRDPETGAFTLLEVNPRVWVSVACPALAGVDFTDAYWRMATGGSVTQPDYETGVGTHRLLGEAMYLLSVARDDDLFVESPPIGAAVREVLASIADQPNFDYLALDDPVPFVRDVLEKVIHRTVGTPADPADRQKDRPMAHSGISSDTEMGADGAVGADREIDQKEGVDQGVDWDVEADRDVEADGGPSGGDGAA